MSIFRVALLTAAVVLLLPPSQAKADDSVGWGMGKASVAPAKGDDVIGVQYLGGTVKAIPADSFGTLNLKDAKDLRFEYGASVFRLPYTQITETQVTEINKGHWLVHMPRKKRYDTLTINYRDANGAENTLNFQVSSKLSEPAEASIGLRRQNLEEASADPDSYWGDKIWKTQRTLPLFEQKQKPASTALAVGAGGTK